MFCPKAWKNLCLFAGSLLFYLYGVKDTPWYLALFLVSIIVNYRMSFWIDGSLEPVQKKRRLAAGVILICLFWPYLNIRIDYRWESVFIPFRRLDG